MWEKSETPISIQDYAVHENVLPSPRVLNDHKQRKTATALNQIESGVKVTLHFDATSRLKTGGDWPDLILTFSDKCWFSLQRFFFASEDHTQIVGLIAETYKRLAPTINVKELAISAKLLWEMT